jgi:hypothetical protein
VADQLAVDPTVIAAAGGAAKLLFTLARGDLPPCKMRFSWRGVPWIGDLWGWHITTDGRFHQRLKQRGLVSYARHQWRRWKARD